MKRVLILATAAILAAAEHSSEAERQLKAAVNAELVNGDLKAAIKQYAAIVAKFKADRAVTASALVHMAECYQKMGDAESRKIYEQVVKEYGDQKEAVALARARLGRDAKRTDSGIVARQVWSVYPNDQITTTTPSPDGRYIPFVRHRGPGARLALHNLRTGEDRILTSDDGTADGPVVTPDGKRILYSWHIPGGTCELRSVDADGANVRTILAVNSNFQCQPRAISPDGKLAALHTGGGGAPQISIVNLASGQRTVLKSFEWGGPIIGNFSPDGRRLVYSMPVSRGSHDREIYSIAIDGSSETKLVPAPGWHDRVFYTADGSRIVFSSDRSGTPHKWDLWSQRIAGDKPEGAPMLVKPDIGDVWLLGFTRDGTLYFAEQSEESDAYIVAVDPATWRAKGAPTRASERIIGGAQTPRWSPDGKSLAFIGTRIAYPNVTFLVRSGGSSEERQFTVRFTSTQNAQHYRWFPDGKALLLADWEPVTDTSVFRRLDITTGEVRKLFEARMNTGGLITSSISADGRAVYYALREPQSPTGPAHIIRHELATGEEKRLIQIPTNSAMFVSVSADERYVAFFSMNGEDKVISVAPLAGGPPRELWRTKYPGAAAKDGFPWTSDGSGVLVNVLTQTADTAQGPDWPEWHLSFLPIGGGEPREIGIASRPGVEQLISAVHPDGRSVGFTEKTRRRALWTLQNLFPETRATR